MKLKYLVLSLLGWGILAACSDEDAIIPRESEIVLRYEFPQGTNECDEIAEEIKEKHDVYLIYKGFSSLDFSRAWTLVGDVNYFGESLTDEKAGVHVKFMKEHIFNYLPEELTRTVLPLYYFLVDSYRTETINYAGVAAIDTVTNFIGGLDYWVNSIYTVKQKEFPSAAEKLKEHRIRIMKQFFDAAINRGKIPVPASFNDKIDYVAAIDGYATGNDNYYMKRGFLGSLPQDGYKFGTISRISDITPESNFLTYVFAGMRYTEEEFSAIYEKYTLTKEKRLIVMNYMKEKYNIDLEAIGQGPDL